MNSSTVIVLSIQPRHAMNIIKRRKTVELRRLKPKHLGRGSLVLLYASSPLKALVGAFRVSSILDKPVSELWESVRNKACISMEEFNIYYSDLNSGIAIFIDEIWEFPNPIKLSQMREEIDFQPPQSFRYATANDIQLLEYSNISPELNLVHN